MSAPENSRSGPTSQSLFSSLRSFWGVLLAIGQSRLDLLTLELEDEARRALTLTILSLSAVLMTGMTVFFLLCLIVVLLHSHLALALGIICSGCALASVILIVIVRRLFLERPPFLTHTLTELRRDVESLRAQVIAPEKKS